MQAHTYAVSAADLKLAAFAHKLRRRASQPLAPLAVMTPAPLLQVDCCGGRYYLTSMRAHAIRMGHWKSLVKPLDRGHIGRLFDHVQAAHGRAEVLRTWRAGIASLRREPRYTLHLPMLTPSGAEVQP